MHRRLLAAVALVTSGIAASSPAQEQDITTLESVAPAPPRAEGEGPFDRLILRGATLDSARWGLTSMEHWYGLPESLLIVAKAKADDATQDR